MCSALRGSLVAVLLLGIPAAGNAQDLTGLFKKVSPSVVVIRAKGREIPVRRPGRRFNETGSGVLISADGKIVTAAHVVQVMDAISVEVLGGERSPPGSSPRSRRPTCRSSSSTGSPGRRRGPAREFRHGAGREAGHRGRRTLRAEPFAQRGLDQRPVAARHRVQGHAAGRVLPDRRGDQHGQFRRPDVQHGRSRSSASSAISSPSPAGSEGLGFVVTINTVKELLLEKKSFWGGIEGRSCRRARGAPEHSRPARVSAQDRRQGLAGRGPRAARGHHGRDHRGPAARPGRRPGPGHRRNPGKIDGRSPQDPRQDSRAHPGNASKATILREGRVLELTGRVP